MQQCFMYLNLGDGWISVNDHDQDIAAMSGFAIRWGVDDINDQPDPSVMTFTLRDATGRLAGRATTLAGARVLVQVSPQPTWGLLQDEQGAWSAQRVRLSNLHQKYTPGPPNDPSTEATTIFDGIIASGGTLTPRRDGGWTIDLSASSRMILWKRMQDNGPTSTDQRYSGLYWVGTAEERITELNRRATAGHAPQADTTGLAAIGTPAPYDADDHPSQLDLLHRLYSASPDLPLWYDMPDKAESRITAVRVGAPAVIIADTHAHLHVRDDHGSTRPALDASRVITTDDGTLTIPAPVTQIVLQGRKAKADDGILSFDDHDVTMGDRGRLPDNLTRTQSSITLETDTVTGDESDGVWTRGGGTVWTPNDTDRDTWAALIETMDSRIRPETVTFDSRRIDPVDMPALYIAAASGPIAFQGMAAGRLTDARGMPAAAGVYTTIGGTLTYQWTDSAPTLRAETTLWPIPRRATTPTWSDTDGWPAIWDECGITLAEMALINEYEKETG